MNRVFRSIINAMACTGVIALASSVSAAAYSPTGTGSSTIGTGGDYTSLAQACAAVSGTINNNTVANKALTTNVATLTLGAAHTYVVNNSITVSIGDNVFDGTFTVTAITGTTVSYARTNADVASAAASGIVYTTAGTGTRDATAWTFLILNDLTETLNSEIRCTVAAGGSITIRPDANVRANILWPNTIKANANTSGHLLVGVTAGGLTNAFTSTNNIIVDGSNTPGGSTRDLSLTSQTSDTESGLFLRVRGNNDGIQFKNLIINQNYNSATPQVITFTSDVNTADANKCPDNWVVDNCFMSCIATGQTSGTGITSAVTGTIPAGQAQSGYSITNNTILAGSRPILLGANAGGTICGNVIRATPGTALLGFGIDHSAANSATGWTLNVFNNIIDQTVSANISTGDFGQGGIRVATVNGACNINVYNNSIGGWVLTGAAADTNYQGISVRGVVGSASANVKIEHNSINMPSYTNGTGATTVARTYAIGRNHAAGTQPTMVVRNNSIRYLQAGTFANAIYVATAGNLTLTGNNIVVGGTTGGFANIGGTAYANFAAYQGLDAAAQNIDPTTTTGGVWASAASGSTTTAQHFGDLHFTGAPTTLLGTTVAATIATDIDGEARATDGSAIPGADVYNASNNYTFSGTGTADMSVAGNWTPPRSIPRATDTLVFNTGSPTVIVKDQHIGGLKIQSPAAPKFTAFGHNGRAIDKLRTKK